MNLTDEEVKKAIEALESQKSETNDLIGWVKSADRFLDKNKYRGKGRPRSSDYYYRKINWPETLMGKGMVYED